ncbi:MAG: hypothetical protein GOVbin3009_34 [Prokaryotic dsDNA virus sp.]|jgi:membrane-bound ClpP family serine protease|nr:MAG: hypothetical protein GOVbin3009_34 [Prokaryotic dsDNA virus sp.]|tara:strand:- start:304 stop:531 length:228 start_codon:yes stop_codon:yes gene_type:complete
MEAIIQEVKSIYKSTQVRDRQGRVLTSFTGRLWSLILFIAMLGLMTMAITGILFMIGGLIFGYIDASNANFGIYG